MPGSTMAKFRTASPCSIQTTRSGSGKSMQQRRVQRPVNHHAARMRTTLDAGLAADKAVEPRQGVTDAQPATFAPSRIAPLGA